ncbi:MAG: Asp-tRNA(Asn)/Glu-tRNA(Gln) amidotransferase subunit GatA, partial [Eubacteriales bacterium]|nr:Asp-tRNA(Asn)/Glu-tRNA(Gln) amidotransferase subunit GatA [Eubacteriales bacterium]
TLCSAKALEKADQVDKLLAGGEELPLLAGIPLALKDNIAVKGIACTAASKMLENFRPPYNAYVWDELQKASAVLIGKTNMDEFGMGFSTENSYFKTTKNPHDLSRIPGGSSGGSAAAVASGEAIYALGTDTGGSIRQPAAYCGLVGLRPTYGLVSRRGVTALASSMDTVGPLTRTVRDNMIVLSAISAWDAKDCSSSKRSFVLSEDLLKQNYSQTKPLSGMTIGWSEQCFDVDMEEDVKNSLQAALKVFESLGATIKHFQIKSINAALSAYYILMSAEAASNLGRFDGIHYGYRSKNVENLDDVYINSRSEAFGYEVKRRILLGNFALSEEYFEDYFVKAQKVRTVVIREFEELFKECDVILMPVSTSTAGKIGSAPEDPVDLYRGDIFTTPVAVAGLPALSLPCGKDAKGLPIGMQLIGKQFSEDLLYRVGAAYEDQRSPAFELAEVKA